MEVYHTKIADYFNWDYFNISIQCQVSKVKN